MAISYDSLSRKVQQQIQAQREAGQGDPIPKPSGKTKYNNQKSEGWDSKGERRYYKHLLILQSAGEISNLKRQVTVYLCVARRHMRVDFVYLDNTLGELVYDDFKGFPTPAWLIKKDIWAAGLGPGILRITKRAKGEYTRTDIYPKASEEALRRMLDNARRTMGADRLQAVLDAMPAIPVEAKP